MNLRRNAARLIGGTVLFVLSFVLPGLSRADVIVRDTDGSGSEQVTLSGAGSTDLDGVIIDYAWLVNGTTVTTGFGPVVQEFTYVYLLGFSTVTLSVRDDAQATDSASSLVTVLPQSGNLPPVASAIVPSEVQASTGNVAMLFVDASASSDPEGDPITRYRWTEGALVLYDGDSATATLTLAGLGLHPIQLEVFSKDSEQALQSDTETFNVDVVEPALLFANHRFNRQTGVDFAFTGSPYKDYSGLAFNALTQTLFMADSNQNAVLEIDKAGNLLRAIDVQGLKNPIETDADPEGITWLYGDTFAIVMEGGEEMALVDLSPGTTAALRTGATIYTLKGDPKGVAYSPVDDLIYWVSEDTPKRLFRTQINPVTGQLDELNEWNVDALPAFDLAGVVVFPRISPNPFLISSSSQVIMEVNVTGPSPVFVSSDTLSKWNIPDAEGIVFDNDGFLYIVGQTVGGGVPEDDFNIFVPTYTVPNLPPAPQPAAQFVTLDSDGNGFELVTVDDEGSFDPDGAIIDWAWVVNGTTQATGVGTKVPDFTFNFAVGTNTVVLSVRDDALAQAQAQTKVIVKPQGANLPPVASAAVPSEVEASTVNVAEVFVDASASSDPDGDLINRYKWTEGLSTLYDGASATASFLLSGLGLHTVQLQVFSEDGDLITQSSTQTFNVTLIAPRLIVAGNIFNREIGIDLEFGDANFGEYSGLTFNPITQTFYTVDSDYNKVAEFQKDGTFIRAIDVQGLKNPLQTDADPEGITWLFGDTYAITMEAGEEMAIVSMPNGTTEVLRAGATIYDLFGDPKGVTYAPTEDKIYWVSEDSTKTIVQSKLDMTTNELVELNRWVVPDLPSPDFTGIVSFPRISKNLFLISRSSQSIMEVDVTGPSPVFVSSTSLAKWDIPQPEGIAFDNEGKLAVVTQSVGGVPEDHYNVFAPTYTVPNLPPNAEIIETFGAIDADNNGVQDVLVDAFDSADPDGVIITYRWLVEGVEVEAGFGPKVKSLSREFPVGDTVVTLEVTDDAGAAAQDNETVTVSPPTSNLPPVAQAIVPPSGLINQFNEVEFYVDASSSFDPEGDPLFRYRWTENLSTLYDGDAATATLTVQSLGNHPLKLTVYSVDASSVVQSGSADFFFSPFPGRLRV